MKKILTIITIIFTVNLCAFAQNTTINFQNNQFEKQKRIECHKQKRDFDLMLETRLNLTAEQKKQIDENRLEYRKEMQKTVKKMEYLSKKIKRIYETKTSKIQADVESTPLKLELVLLKQKADKIRIENRKKFESILNDAQKAEFEKIKQEFHNKKRMKNNTSSK